MKNLSEFTPEEIQQFLITQNEGSEVERFTKYVNEFYNIEYGIYPIATTEEIETAIQQFLNTPTDIPIEYDSLDRERVRTILEPTYTIF
jgi:hypothetical protein